MCLLYITTVNLQETPQTFILKKLNKFRTVIKVQKIKQANCTFCTSPQKCPTPWGIEVLQYTTKSIATPVLGIGIGIRIGQYPIPNTPTNTLETSVTPPI